MSHVKVSDDTFVEVPDLFNQSKLRIPMALVSIGFTLGNICVIVGTSTYILMTRDVWGPLSEAEDSFVSYLIFSIIRVSDHRGRLAINPRVMVSFFELSILFMCILRCLRLALISSMPSAKSSRLEIAKYHASANFFWSALDQLSTVSAMTMLCFVTPSLVAKELPELGGASSSKWETTREVTVYAVQRLACLIVGADAFFVKLGELAEVTDGSLRDLILLRIFFLRQCLGIFQMRFYLQRRLFQFVFGGEDGTIDHKDYVKMEVWRAMLVKKIWDSYKWKDSWPGIRYWCMMLTYSDTDFQRLILDDPENPSSRHDSPRIDLSTKPPWPMPAVVPTGSRAAVGPWPAADGGAGAPNVQRLQEQLQQSELRAAEARVGELCAKMELHQLRSAAQGEAFAREVRELR